MNTIRNIIRGCTGNVYKQIYPIEYETFYDSDKEIIKLDLTKLETIGTIEDLRSINKEFKENQIDELQQLWLMYFTMEKCIKQHKSRKITLGDIVMRLIKFKLLYINYLTKLKQTSTCYALSVADSGLDVLNVGYLFIYVDHYLSKHKVELVNNTYIYYMTEVKLLRNMNT
jgi:hypothetical protein